MSAFSSVRLAFAIVWPFVLISSFAAPQPSYAQASIPDLSDAQNGKDGIASPAVITRGPPFYPTPSARLNREGNVTVSFVIREDGTISDAFVSVSSGYSDIDNAALASVLEEFFRPASRDGHYIAVRWKQTVKYQLKD